MTDIPNNIKLQIGSDGVTKLKFHPTKNSLVVGTREGRIRIYDCTKKAPEEVFRKQWHKNLTNLEISKSGSKILTSSSQGCIKQHDFETGKTTWTNLNAHEKDISALIYQTEELFISGDDFGVLKFWDSRQQDPTFELNVCGSNSADSDQEIYQYGNNLSSINDILLDDNGRYLFVAMDDGTLVTVNARKRTIELKSETLSYSARSIVTLKNQTKLGVATDEGVVTIFNWKQFGNLSDRFPIVKKNIQIEKMIKISENVVALGTNTGVIKAASLLPNFVLNDIGVQLFPEGYEDCGDCMTMTINHSRSIIATGCIASNIVCFFSTETAINESSIELQDRMENKRKGTRSLIEQRKKRRIEADNGFLDGLCEIEKSQDSESKESNDNDEDSSDEDD